MKNTTQSDQSECKQDESFNSLTPVQQFLMLLNKGVNSWLLTGRFLVEQLNKNPTFMIEVRQADPAITMDMLNTLEGIGRGQINPKLLLLRGHIVNAIKKQPRDVQDSVLRDPVIVVDEAGKEKPMPAYTLTAQQAKQVFSKTGIRSAQEQRQFRHDESNKESEKGWAICGDRIWIKHAQFFTMRQWKEIGDALAKV